MEKYRAQARLFATVLLGVIAVAALVGGVFILFGAWVIQNDDAGRLDDVGAAATAIIGILTLVFALAAALAAHEEWLGRPRGQALGLGVAIVAFLAAIVPLVVGRLHGTEPLFYIAMALAVVTAVPLLVPQEERTVTSH